jgi:hypothetical protein
MSNGEQFGKYYGVRRNQGGDYKKPISQTPLLLASPPTIKSNCFILNCLNYFRGKYQMQSKNDRYCLF